MRINNFLITVLLTLLSISQAFSQIAQPRIHVNNLSELNMKEKVNLHIISPEPIQFVDMSSDLIEGDMPTDNIARFKLKKNDDDSFPTGEIGVITVVGQSFMAQYKIINDNELMAVESNIQIQPDDMQPLEFIKHKLGSAEFKKFSLDILKQKNVKKKIRRKKNFLLEMTLNNIYVVDNYIFVDISVRNESNLPFNIENISFAIDDKKIYKATNYQTIALKPVYEYSKQKKISDSYRNIFVFEKFTFPNSKVLNIKLIEEQISGRFIELNVKYSDVLEADTI